MAKIFCVFPFTNVSERYNIVLTNGCSYFYTGKRTEGMGCIVKADEYRKMIILLINKMSDEEMLKRIFEYVHSQYIKK